MEYCCERLADWMHDFIKPERGYYFIRVQHFKIKGMFCNTAIKYCPLCGSNLP